MKSDAHMHPFEHVRDFDRGEAKDVMRAFAERARQRGFSEIAFTEHCPLLPCISDQHFETYVQLALEVIDETQEPRIYLGVEMDYHPRLLDKVNDLLDKYPFDYVLGSVHVHTALYREEIHGKTYDEAIALALRMAGEAVASGMFDTIAHLDFVRWLSDPKRFGQWPGEYEPMRHRDAFMAIFGEMEKHGIALEINSSGLKKTFASVLPCAEVLAWAGEFEDLLYIFGSDAHDPESVGQFYDTALQTLSARQFGKLTGVSELVLA